ncbi:MAG: aminotransferase class I/II-fold pyridoxal phosphate-dependent enzyme [Erysipelotrichaceae bacterium]|nr:aminotransferase class I/II-fold pyridoxal phosphate-dependent enzyme [Erysipelotrichaceae bacterium]
MKFLKPSENLDKYVDNIFSVVNAAKNDPEAINATAGCLYDEDGKMFTYDCVSEVENSITPIRKSAYAQSPAGNKSYLESLSRFILEDRVTNHNACLATPGGTGAISTAIRMTLEEGDTIIYPEIAWGNYKVICNENNLN